MHYLNPSAKSAHVIFLYRNFAKHHPNFSHVGLGVNALHSIKTLRKMGIRADAYGVWDVKDARRVLKKYPSCTHLIVEAIWLRNEELQGLCWDHEDVHFVVRGHSQIGFLQVEPGAINTLRANIHLQDQVANLTISANARQFCDYIRESYDAKILYLPNLYDYERATEERWKSPQARDTLRMSSFGALRIMKNHSTSAAAALMLAKSMGCNLEFYVSVNREEQGKGVIDSLRAMFRGLKYAALVENPWETWSEFRRTVQHMDLCWQLSMTETFNITVADAAAASVPSVVGECIEWAPRNWRASIDSAEEAAGVGLNLLNDHKAGSRGKEALVAYAESSKGIWKGWLDSNPTV